MPFHQKVLKEAVRRICCWTKELIVDTSVNESQGDQQQAYYQLLPANASAPQKQIQWNTCIGGDLPKTDTSRQPPTLLVLNFGGHIFIKK